MSAPGGEDFCEYVFNPLMRQYQAMMRLLQMLRDSQAADCNDIQCFDPANPNGALGGLNANSTSSLSMMSTYGPMLFIWALFVFALFMFRPNSMRKPSKNAVKSAASLNNGALNNNRNNNNDDDDNSTIS